MNKCWCHCDLASVLLEFLQGLNVAIAIEGPILEHYLFS